MVALARMKSNSRPISERVHSTFSVRVEVGRPHSLSMLAPTPVLARGKGPGGGGGIVSCPLPLARSRRARLERPGRASAQWHRSGVVVRRPVLTAEHDPVGQACRPSAPPDTPCRRSGFGLSAPPPLEGSSRSASRSRDRRTGTRRIKTSSYTVSWGDGHGPKPSACLAGSVGGECAPRTSSNICSGRHRALVGDPR